LTTNKDQGSPTSGRHLPLLTALKRTPGYSSAAICVNGHGEWHVLVELTAGRNSSRTVPAVAICSSWAVKASEAGAFRVRAVSPVARSSPAARSIHGAAAIVRTPGLPRGVERGPAPADRPAGDVPRSTTRFVPWRMAFAFPDRPKGVVVEDVIVCRVSH
jgi:hypothetical protein